MQNLVSKIAICAMVLWGNHLAIAQSLDTPGERFRVEGLVTNAITGEPVSHAAMGIQFLSGPSSGLATQTITADAGGHYEFGNLVEGNYLLWAERRGFAREEMGSASGGGALHVGPSKNGFAVRMHPFSSVTGTITDENGDPIMGAHVEIIQTTLLNGRKTMRHVQSATTNDIGAFRAANLNPVKTYVMAWAPGSEEDDAVYPPAFFGGGTDITSAIALDLNVAPSGKADIRLEPAQAFHVHGRLMNMPPNGGLITLISRALPPGLPDMPRPVQMKPDGSFEIRNVTPGAYRVTATTFQEKERSTVTQDVAVSSADIEGLQLTPLPAAEITGRLRVDQQATGSVLNLGGINLFFQPQDLSSAPYVSARINPDGTFAVAGLGVAEYSLVVRLPEPYYVKSAVAGSLDLLAGSLVMVPGVPIAPLDLVVTSGGGELSGTVTVNSQPVGSSVVLLKRQNMAGTAQDKLTQTNGDGKFVIRGIAPGEYQAYAWPDLRGVEYANPQALQQYRSERVTIGENARETVSLQANQQEGQ